MIEIKNLVKTYKLNNDVVEALKDVSLTIEDGDIFGIIGMSGAGKSTFVRCLNMLEKPNSGQIIIDGEVVSEMDEKQLRQLRKKVTMIFQDFNLLMQSTCLENVMFPLRLTGVNKTEAKQKAQELLKTVGLLEKQDAYPAMLSGGQQQRVAIARALASNPSIILCDEATSALDPNTTNQILDLIRDINEKLKITVVIITHQMSVVENICNKVAILDNGEIVETGIVTDVFSHPKSSAAKKLVFPEADTSSTIINDLKQKVIRVVFNGASSAGQPLIATLAIEKGVAANIIYASLKDINEKTYGSLLLSVKDDKQANITKEYLNNIDGVNAEEFNLHE